MMARTKADKGKASVASNKQELEIENMSLEQLLDKNYIQESPGRKLALNVESKTKPGIKLLLRIVRNQIKNIEDPDLSAFQEAMQERLQGKDYIQRQEENLVIAEAYQYFIDLLNTSLSEENLFKFISLSIKAEFKNCTEVNTIFRNDDCFVKKYLQNLFRTKEKAKRFSQMSVNAQRYLQFILNQRREQLSSQNIVINYPKDFFTLIEFNFSVSFAKSQLTESQQSKIYKAIAKSNKGKPVLQSVFFCFKNPDTDQNKNPGLSMLETFYTSTLEEEQLLKDQQQTLLDDLTSKFSELQKQGQERLKKEIQCLVEYKEHPAKSEFKEALNNIYEAIKSNKLLGFGKTSEATKELFEKIKTAKNDKECLAFIESYRQAPENAGRDAKKLFDAIYGPAKKATKEADLSISLSP